MTTHICDFTKPDSEPESARYLLYRYGLPEDVVDGALRLHAQELAAVQRQAHDERRPHFHMGLPCTPGFGCHVAELIDLIDPTKTPAAPAVPAGQAPDTDRATGVAAAIRTFPFDDFGMDDVSIALEDDPGAQEWVPALADAILATLPETTAQAVEQRDYWHGEAMSATERIIELERKLAAAPAVVSAVPGQTDEVRHAGGRVNAEDCPACSASENPPPYPWICPGPEQPAAGAQQPKEA